MSCSSVVVGTHGTVSRRFIYRVSGDDGPPIYVTHHGVDVTGWTITARFTKPSGEIYTLTATITEPGDGADVPAEYNFTFAPGNLTAGDHLFDFHYSAAALDDYSVPAKSRLMMTVRDA